MGSNFSVYKVTDGSIFLVLKKILEHMVFHKYVDFNIAGSARACFA
jgi:hypothetical protein